MFRLIGVNLHSQKKHLMEKKIEKWLSDNVPLKNAGMSS